MSDFRDFANLARAAFPKLNISVLMFERQTAKGIHTVRHRLRANGPGLLAAVVSEADTATQALVDLQGAVRIARRTYATELAIRDISRAAGGLDEDAQGHIRRQLMNCPLLAFDGLVANLRQAARESAQEQQEAA
ncbi:MAG: hypothetical protein ACRYFR_04775 [Janthinobacterium lividum]